MKENLTPEERRELQLNFWGGACYVGVRGGLLGRLGCNP